MSFALSSKGRKRDVHHNQKCVTLQAKRHRGTKQYRGTTMTLEQRMGWVEQRQGTSDYRVQALQDSMIGLNRFSLKLDRKFDTLEENIAAVARDL